MLLLYICKVLLFILSATSGSLSIECFNCSNVLNLSECNTTVTCNDGQVCYKSQGKTDQIMYDFGCADKLNCASSNSQKQNVSELFQADSCFECCSENNCNKHLCEKLSVCKDKSLECALLNSTITICENAKEAKIICKKYCNLCHIVDGKWSKWSEWAKCDVTCGNGSLIRHRECDSPAPKHGGLECPGDGIDKKPCFAHLCPAHGGWSKWEGWEECSATCGVGMRSRKRSCTNPRPHRFGDHCFGDSIEDKLCNTRSCAAHGGWSKWEDWGECSATCGIGMRSRKRSCTNPRPHRFGDHCFGNGIEDEMCKTGSCAVDGGWTEWSQWRQCPVLCGVGLQSRTRSCTNPSPANAGKQCVGQNFDVKLCYSGICGDYYDIYIKAYYTYTGRYDGAL
ncbi:A disintegrin and metalloproteinase with thrombospondin motifs adt-1-like [Ruditapes philippinarum]|uniref:A disintegrin and metalloproteinase with thrombospondin motifs adt-1-like n=1 Tax=Ruditapes philippinarum TaxID=129788 RepID=UPI00295AB554|nr:A disintegrin and metalloproteinase with thrombospondin motifs adt-1-like [Ruditapes philippinarum]